MTWEHWKLSTGFLRALVECRLELKSCLEVVLLLSGRKPVLRFERIACGLLGSGLSDDEPLPERPVHSLPLFRSNAE